MKRKNSATIICIAIFLFLGAEVFAPGNASASATCETLNSGSKLYVSSNFPADIMLLSLLDVVYDSVYLALGKTVNADGVYTWTAYHGDFPSSYASIQLQKTDKNYWRFSIELNGSICTGFLRTVY